MERNNEGTKAQEGNMKGGANRVTLRSCLHLLDLISLFCVCVCIDQGLMVCLLVDRSGGTKCGHFDFVLIVTKNTHLSIPSFDLRSNNSHIQGVVE